MSEFYVGRCPICGVINAGALVVPGVLVYAGAAQAMIDSGLVVSRMTSDTLSIERCKHCENPKRGE